MNSRQGTVDQTSAPLAREFATRPLSDEYWAGEVDDISRSYRDLPVLDQSVVWLWEELGAHCRATAAMLRESFQITVYDDLDPYATSEEMLADIDRGIYKVTSLHSHHPVWDVATNVAFRITHDITGHALTGSDFSFKGEVTAYRNQCMSTPEHLWPVLFTEVVAQSAYCNVHHLFGEQKVALIPLTQAEIDEHVGQIMDAPDAAYDATHRSASQQQWDRVADALNARQAAVQTKPVLHLLSEDDEDAVRQLREHHGLSATAALPPSDEVFGHEGLQRLIADKGFTVNSHFGDNPTSGYMVSTVKNSEEVYPLASITAEDIAAYRRKHASALASPNSYMGAWVWEGNVYLDVSTHVPEESQALTLARQHDQLGIYDLSTGQTIETSKATAASRRLFATRTCDRCGGRVAPFIPRKRMDNGDLVCRGCEAHDEQQRALENFRVSVLDTGASEPLVVWAGAESGEAFGRAREEAQDPDCRRVAVEAKVSDGTYETIWTEGVEMTQKVAHDSGDGVTIYHCFSCGAGSVIARSDGTAQCQFCDTCFTVQVQPERSAMPQTINGVPHQHPDMPGSSPDTPPVQPAQPDPQGADHPATPTQHADADHPAKPVQQGDHDATPAKSDHLPPWLKNKKSSYRTITGGELPEEAYLRHLALRYADDREQVLAAITSRNEEE